MVIKDQGSRRSVESNLLKFPQEIRSYDGDEETEPSLWTKQQLSSSKELGEISRRRTERDTSLITYRTMQTSPIGWGRTGY